MGLNGGWIGVVTGVLGVVGPGIGTVLWFLYQSVRADAKAAGAKAESLKTELAEYKLHVAENYVTQTNLAEKISSLQGAIERLITTVNQNSKETREVIGQLYDRLDKKVDK